MVAAQRQAPPPALPASWHLASGALSGATSVLALQPLDLIKTRLQERPGTQGMWQTVKDVLKKDGAKGLWRGTTPTLYRNIPGVSLYFLSLSRLRSALGQAGYFIPRNSTPSTNGKIKLTTAGDLVVGSTARTGVGFILMPFTLLKTLSESTKGHSSSLATLGSLYRSGGIATLWRGAVPTALRDAPGAGLFVVFYERGRRLLGIRGEGAVGGGLAGSTASVASTLLTTPFDVLKTQRQVAIGSEGTMWSTVVRIYKTAGIRGFWGGGGLRVARKAGSAGIGWAVYEGVVGFGNAERSKTAKLEK